MSKTSTLYPNYSVLDLADEWDSHTKEVVKKRLGPFSEHKILSKKESEMLAAIARHLVYEHRQPILDWVVYFIDSRLAEDIGEGERKPNVLPEKHLIRQGLVALDDVASAFHAKEFLELTVKEQFDLLSRLQLGTVPKWGVLNEPKLASLDKRRWGSVPQGVPNEALSVILPQKEFFTKLVGLTVSAYFSHPEVWSEIGYGGPAYPRGYVRVEQGITDPWEPRREEK